MNLYLGIVAVAYWIYPNLAQDRAEIASLEQQYAEKERKILEGQAIEQRLPEFEREIANLERRLGDVQQILPTQTETGDLLRWIKNLGDQSNLDLKSFAPGALKPVEFYKEFPIEMQYVARYHDLGIFLDRVSKYSRIINVDNLRINAVIGRAGALLIEVADLAGKPIPGRTFADCAPLVGDHHWTTVTWKEHDDLGHTKGSAIMLRFKMKQARIFGLEFV